jgi:ParB-like nuclease family protein
MAQLIPISTIVVDRELGEGDDLTPLAKSMQERGQEVPILTDADYVLIDGLRRIHALRMLGATEVLVTATSMYPVACDVLKRARLHGLEAMPLTPRRLYEINSSMKPVLYSTINFYKIGRKKGTPAKGTAGGRKLLAESLDIQEGVLQATFQVFYAVEQKDPMTEEGKKALEALELLETGQISAYAAVGRLNPSPGLNGKIRKYPDQKDALDAAIASLRGTMRALRELGPMDKKFPKQEAETKYRELIQIRTQFYKFIRTLDEEINKNV